MDQLPKKQFDLFLADLLENHISDVRQLMATNGFDTSGIADEDVKIAFLKAIKDSASFRNSAAKYMAQLAQYKSNFTGGYLNALTDTISQDTIDSHISSVTGTAANTSTTQKSSFWQTLGGVASTENLNKLFGTGLDVLSTKLAANANKDSEERALELERIRLQQLQTQAALKATTSVSTPGLSTGAWIAIGLGSALLIGTVIYFAVKKK